MSDHVRGIQIEFAADGVERLERIRELVETSTCAEVVRAALLVFEYLAQQRSKGYDIALIKDDVVRIVKFV